MCVRYYNYYTIIIIQITKECAIYNGGAMPQLLDNSLPWYIMNNIIFPLSSPRTTIPVGL